MAATVLSRKSVILSLAAVVMAVVSERAPAQAKATLGLWSFAKVNQAGSDVRRKELGKLRGEWRIVEATIDGKKLPAPALKQAYVRFGDGKLTYYMPPTEPNQADFGPRTSLFEIDPEKTPKTLDVFEKENPKERGLAIYELKGDELRMVMADPIGAPRPDRFAGRSPEPDEKNRPTWTLLVLRREK